MKLNSRMLLLTTAALSLNVSCATGKHQTAVHESPRDLTDAVEQSGNISEPAAYEEPAVNSQSTPVPELSENDRALLSEIHNLFDSGPQCTEEDSQLPESDDSTLSDPEKPELQTAESDASTTSEPNLDSENIRKYSQIIASESLRVTTNAVANGIKPAKVPLDLPKNTRQVSEGHWLGSMPQAQNVDALYARKIRLVITATRKQNDLEAANTRMQELGITHIVLPFGGKFPKPSRFYKTVIKFQPEHTFIHCDHGGDRSGAMLAYLLVARHHWSIQHALLAVLNPGQTDVNGLTKVLEDRGYTITQSDINRYLGIYSATYNGGGGGLKVRSDDYKKLINTLIDAIEI